jgi:hypothetical protein
VESSSSLLVFLRQRATGVAVVYGNYNNSLYRLSGIVYRLGSPLAFPGIASLSSLRFKRVILAREERQPFQEKC